ncbi:unnamed protein product, partial [Laminaria digitata]
PSSLTCGPSPPPIASPPMSTSMSRMLPLSPMSSMLPLVSPLLPPLAVAGSGGHGVTAGAPWKVARRSSALVTRCAAAPDSQSSAGQGADSVVDRESRT